ncbi:MAG: radical SAM family heme chaperone HemW [Andreesenia angusta]|nr:radical SAM family heme chaperone HemW [Andreesenia angusta]
MEGIYIHIPFCESKCKYCDFNSFTNKEKYVEKYIKYLKKEIDLYGKENFKNSKTIFIGGGTPSSIESEYIVEILEKIYEKNNKENFEEITIEVNPGSIDESKISDYKNAGINRISLGVQSLDDNILKSIGRVHNAKIAIESIKTVKRYIENISVDLIFGLPNQKIENIKNDIEVISKLGVNHMSFYALKIEENTPFYEMERNGKLNLPTEDIERDMYHIGKNILEENGYYQYEISNFSKTGFESKHNLIYWNVEPYIGLGLSAASNIDGKRYNNMDNFEDYFDSINSFNLPIDSNTIEEIDLKEEISEYSILRLRLNEGIVKSEFKKRYGKDIRYIYGDILDKNKENGLLIEDKDRIYLSDKGFDLANQVFMDFLR